ncbi:hypothetical protein GGX14DRAFT_648065 [Mycena pura]|uniref:F-box domain-containing protein n=1 Tax=Mycena pura TaxID=153505 RepID=A0AAD6Y6D6_9AGAR|nr:hypothetical protein GGX14DRAFT_648065 [Mycena pura]
MAALQLQMTSLRAQKERVLDDLERIEASVEIFYFLAVIRQEHHRPQPYYGLLRLASVCQTWRAVTLSRRALWNEVTVTCDNIRDAGQLLAACLPRAGSLPLDLYIRLPADDSSRSTILSTLGLYGSQWRHVRLIKLPSDRLPSTFPLLERLELFGFSIPHLLAVLPHAQNLKCLALASGRASSTEYAPAAPPSILLPHLHTFNCNDNPTAMVLQYLTLPALESLRLGFLSDTGVHVIMSCVARSSSTIRTLELICLTFSATYNCLHGLSTVRHLCLSCIWPYDEERQFLAAMISVGFLPALESLTCNEYLPDSAETLVAVVSARWRGVKGTTRLLSASLDFGEQDGNYDPTFSRLPPSGTHRCEVVDEANRWDPDAVANGSSRCARTRGRVPRRPLRRLSQALAGLRRAWRSGDIVSCRRAGRPGAARGTPPPPLQ